MAGRPADAAAGDAPTVTKHAVEGREVLVAPASYGTPVQVGSGEGVSAPPHLDSNMPEPDNHHWLEGEAVNIQVGRELSILILETSLHGRLTHPSEPTLESHAPLEEHDESLVPKRRRGRLLAMSHGWVSGLR